MSDPQSTETTAATPTAPPTAPPAAQPAAPPLARREPVTRTHHGDTVTDPYEWLRDAEDPSVLEHLAAENAWATARTAHLAGLREQLFEEVRSRTQESDLSVPGRNGGWWYYTRTVEGSQYPLIARVPVTDPEDWTPPTTTAGAALEGEQVMLDGNAEAGESAFFSFGAVAVSPDGARLAWSCDTTGDERYALRVRDLTTGEDLPELIEGLSGSASWANDSATLFYLRVDEAWRPHEVVRHVVGTDAPDGSEDPVVLTEPDERYWLGLGRTRSGRYLMAVSGSKTTAETRVLDADRPQDGFAVLLARREGVDHSAEHVVLPVRRADGTAGTEDRFLVLHNDEAQDFQLDLTPDASLPAAPPERWTTVLAHEVGTRLEQVDAFAGFVAVGYRHEALPRVGVIDLLAAPRGGADDEGDDDHGDHEDGGEGGDGPADAGAAALQDFREITFDEPLSSAHVVGGRQFDQPVLRLVHTSFTTPATVFDLHVATGDLLLRRRTPVLGGYDPADYEEHRTWATAPDGTQVPVSVVRRAGVAQDGSAPGLLYGYGSYEHSTDPSFSTSRLSLLDRGVVFAVAHVRGGGEMGRHWYEDGKGLAKPHSFSDFVAVAEHLVERGWVDGDRLLAMGGSAGGLLVGAVANLAPQRFAGILAAVPFVDPLTTMLDESIPLTVVEQEEWGDPIRDADVYACMKGYAPYDNVAPVQYPPILVVTSLHDTRVLFTEPAKWVARLRELTLSPDGADGAPHVLLKIELDGGHGGRSGRYEEWRERAWEYAWALDAVGLA